MSRLWLQRVASSKLSWRPLRRSPENVPESGCQTGCRQPVIFYRLRAGCSSPHVRPTEQPAELVRIPGPRLDPSQRCTHRSTVRGRISPRLHPAGCLRMILFPTPTVRVCFPQSCRHLTTLSSATRASSASRLRSASIPLRVSGIVASAVTLGLQRWRTQTNRDQVCL